MKSTARVELERASRYLQQLAKHFAHKVDVKFSEDAATISLGYGQIGLRTDGPQVLVMTTTSQTDEHRKRLEHVAASHLERFAFRDPPEIVWSDDG